MELITKIIKVDSMDSLYAMCKIVFEDSDYIVNNAIIYEKGLSIPVSSYEAICYVNSTVDYMEQLVMSLDYQSNTVDIRFDAVSCEVNISSINVEAVNRLVGILSKSVELG